MNKLSIYVIKHTLQSVTDLKNEKSKNWQNDDMGREKGQNDRIWRNLLHETNDLEYENGLGDKHDSCLKKIVGFWFMNTYYHHWTIVGNYIF